MKFEINNEDKRKIDVWLSEMREFGVSESIDLTNFPRLTYCFTLKDKEIMIMIKERITNQRLRLDKFIMEDILTERTMFELGELGISVRKDCHKI